MKAFLQLVRYPNLLIIAFTQILIFYQLPSNGFFKKMSLEANCTHFMAILFATILTAAAGYIINDYYDVGIDLINKKEKVIVGKKITKRNALILYTVLNVSALALSFYFPDFKISIIVFSIIILLFLYAYKLKQIFVIGNVLISLLSASSILILIFAKDINLIVSLSILAFFISWVREIIKDLEDIKGDSAFGHKNMSIVLGENTSLWIARFLLLVLSYLLLSFYPLFKSITPIISLLYFALLFFQIAYNLYLTFTKNYAVMSISLKVLMVCGVCLIFLI